MSTLTRAVTKGTADERSSPLGRVRIGKGIVITGMSIVKRSSIVGENFKIGPSVYVGPYAVIGDKCHIMMADGGDSIAMYMPPWISRESLSGA